MSMGANPYPNGLPMPGVPAAPAPRRPGIPIGTGYNPVSPADKPTAYEGPQPGHHDSFAQAMGQTAGRGIRGLQDVGGFIRDAAIGPHGPGGFAQGFSQAQSQTQPEAPAHLAPAPSVPSTGTAAQAVSPDAVKGAHIPGAGVPSVGVKGASAAGKIGVGQKPGTSQFGSVNNGVFTQASGLDPIRDKLVDRVMNPGFTREGPGGQTAVYRGGADPSSPSIGVRNAATSADATHRLGQYDRSQSDIAAQDPMAPYGLLKTIMGDQTTRAGYLFGKGDPNQIGSLPGIRTPGTPQYNAANLGQAAMDPVTSGLHELLHSDMPYHVKIATIAQIPGINNPDNPLRQVLGGWLTRQGADREAWNKGQETYRQPSTWYGASNQPRNSELDTQHRYLGIDPATGQLTNTNIAPQ